MWQTDMCIKFKYNICSTCSNIESITKTVNLMVALFKWSTEAVGYIVEPCNSVQNLMSVNAIHVELFQSIDRPTVPCLEPCS